MRKSTALVAALAAVTFLSVAGDTQASLLGCGCSHGPAAYAPVMYSDPGIDVGCDCAAAATSCCGIGGGGLVQLGNLYGSGEVYGGNFAGGSIGNGNYARGSHLSADPRSFQSGFESLPNMDGGGVHHRLPFHSYRRPWAHPGIPDNNINIVW